MLKNKSLIAPSDLSLEEIEELLALAEREGFPAVGLAGELAELAALSGAWLHGFPNSLPGIGHWNRDGHRLAGELLAHTVCRLGLGLRQGAGQDR